jgi:hypothetical protein
MKLDWFDNVSDTVLSFSFLPIGQQALEHSSGTYSVSHRLEDFPNWTSTEGNSPNSYIHASVSDLYTVFL